VINHYNPFFLPFFFGCAVFVETKKAKRKFFFRRNERSLFEKEFIYGEKQRKWDFLYKTKLTSAIKLK